MSPCIQTNRVQSCLCQSTPALIRTQSYVQKWERIGTGGQSHEAVKQDGIPGSSWRRNAVWISRIAPSVGESRVQTSACALNL